MIEVCRGLVDDSPGGFPAAGATAGTGVRRIHALAAILGALASFSFTIFALPNCALTHIFLSYFFFFNIYPHTHVHIHTYMYENTCVLFKVGSSLPTERGRSSFVDGPTNGRTTKTRTRTANAAGTVVPTIVVIIIGQLVNTYLAVVLYIFLTVATTLGHHVR